MRRRLHVILGCLFLFLCTQRIFAQGNMRIKPVPPAKKTAPGADNAPPNPRMFIMLILRNKPIPPAVMQEYTAKEYKGKIPEYDLKKMDPDLFKVFKSQNLTVLPGCTNNMTVNRDADRQVLSIVSVMYHPIKMPPPEVDPVQNLTIRNARNEDKNAVPGMQASKVALPKTKVPEPEADPNAALADKTPLNNSKRKQRGYKNIVYEKVVTKELPVASSAPATPNTVQNKIQSPPSVANANTNANPNWRTDIPVIYDTVRSWKRRPEQEEMVVTSHHDTIYVIPGDYDDTYVESSVKPPTRTSMLKEGSCQCMQMVMTAQDTVNFEDYVNYGFKFTNNCKEYVFVHSFSFKFAVYETNGFPAKRLRRIDFVKRFDYPEFVKIRPGATYEYHFADDPFFEYDLVRGKQYKFTFMYNNISKRSPDAPQHTHVCNDPQDKVIYIQ